MWQGSGEARYVISPELHGTPVGHPVNRTAVFTVPAFVVSETKVELRISDIRE